MVLSDESERSSRTISRVKLWIWVKDRPVLSFWTVHLWLDRSRVVIWRLSKRSLKKVNGLGRKKRVLEESRRSLSSNLSFNAENFDFNNLDLRYYSSLFGSGNHIRGPPILEPTLDTNIKSVRGCQSLSVWYWRHVNRQSVTWRHALSCDWQYAGRFWKWCN